MSLGYIYVCCDDGHFYNIDVIVAADWRIFIEESGDNTFRVPSQERGKGRSRYRPRPITDPMELICRDGLPITNLKFVCNETRGGLAESVYTIKATNGPFPRLHLPTSLTPTTSPQKLATGTFAFCMTQTLKTLKEAT
ncbi:hypothetical protein [Planctomicrobium piriforme]|uniref:Uncharacterized protein n=1 Tax=Planctomicrobium piriforme TaxID=1576369 RepID=A0A1I3EHH6_9PLAN|nr:hypothetical protein [Planctomicrobium piriforme]SFH98323.1 hypothetical protein SAMN05421753_104221 [Planctomicrobium piriforme]